MKILVTVLVLAFGGIGVYAWVSDRAADETESPDVPAGEEETPSKAGGPGPNAGGFDGAGTPEGKSTDVAEKKPVPVTPDVSGLPSLGDPLSDGVQGILVDLITGKATPADEVALVGRLTKLLSASGLGTIDSREQAANAQIKLVLRKMGQAPGGGAADVASMSPLQRMAVKGLTREIVGDLYRRLPGNGGGGHEGSLIGAAPDVKLPEGYVKAPWNVLGAFEYEEGMTLPDSVTAFNGKNVGVTGYMITLEEVEDIHEFLLVESLWSCCFGTPPEVHQVLVIKIPGDDGIDFTTSPILVLGKMEVSEEVEDGFVTSIYRVVADKVEEVE